MCPILHSYDWIFVFQVRDDAEDIDEFQKEWSMKRVISAIQSSGDVIV